MIVILLCNFLDFHLIFHPKHLAASFDLIIECVNLYIQQLFGNFRFISKDSQFHTLAFLFQFQFI